MTTPAEIAAAQALIDEYNESYRTQGELPFPMAAYNLLERADKEKHERSNHAEQ